MSQKYEPGQKVELRILRETDLGFVASINETVEGLLYHSEIFEKLSPGQRLPGYIKKQRPDGAIDLQLHAFGSLGSEELGSQILDALIKAEGFLPLTDKTPPEVIYNYFGVSKKKYKMALGGLYKKRQIKITDDGIELVKK